MLWSIELTFWLINTLLSALWNFARKSINSKRTYTISICLFAKSYKENMFKVEKNKRQEDVFLLHVCSSDSRSVNLIKNNVKYLKSAAITSLGYWFTRLKTLWIEDGGALINTDSWKNPWWLLAVGFSKRAQYLKEKCKHVSEEEEKASIFTSVPRKLRRLFNDYCAEP